MGRALAAMVLLAPSLALAHDVSADFGLSAVKPTDQNPRSGSATGNVSGSIDFNDAWSAWGGLTYTRDFATRTDQTSSPGSNVFLLSAGAMWLPSDHLSLMLGGTFSPKAIVLSATTVSDPESLGRIDALIRSENTSWGVTALAAYATNGVSDWESTIDGSVGLTGFNVFQQAQPAGVAQELALRTFCRLSASEACKLINGAAVTLAQLRLELGYTATLGKLDAGVEVAAFVYDKNPDQVGRFALLELGRDVGNGVPVAPFLLTLRPSVAYRISSKVTVRLAYQLGIYTGATGSNQLLSLKATVKLTRMWQLSVTVTAQADRESGTLVNTGGSLLVGAVASF